MFKKYGALALTLLLGASTMLFACGEDAPDSSATDGSSAPIASSEVSSETSSETSDDVSSVSSAEDDVDDFHIDATGYDNLNDALDTATGIYAVKIGDVTLTTSSKATVSLGSITLQEAIINGLDDEGEKAKITAVGVGRSIVRGNNGATLHFKNVEFYNETDVQTERLYAYLEFGGKLRFENCDFKYHIFLKDGTDAEFINCTFYSGESDRYGVWVADGKATFENCTFTGYRGLKIHEELAWDVESVVVKNCLFDNLMKKPALAIGDVKVNPENTFITVTGCTFDGCQPWDDVGSLEGIDGFYESDTLTSDFGWTESNNYVGLAPVTKDDIEYKN